MRAKGIFRMGTVRRGGSLLAVLVTASALLLLPLEAVGRADISVRWSRSAGAELASVASGDGAIYVTGSRMKTDGNTAMLLVRYDPSGAVTWTRSWGPRRARTDGTSVAVGPDGSVFVVGNVSAENMEGGGWFIRRYSSNGALLWHRTSS
ncbi:MAG TPA: hypothetical protein VE646_11745, partial [Actinomycetota bacterium]|nr:hypothetical protein [Actinomycetota bacterium]